MKNKLLPLFFCKRTYPTVFCLWPAESETEGNRGLRKEKMDLLFSSNIEASMSPIVCIRVKSQMTYRTHNDPML